MAVALLTMAFMTPSLMMLVHHACDDDWPGGLAWKIVKELLKRYRLQDNIMHVKLQMMLNCIMMKANEDPVKLFEQLSEIKSMYNTNDMTVDEADLIAVVFMVAPEQYQSVIMSVQLEKCDELTLYDLKDSMNQVW